MEMTIHTYVEQMAHALRSQAAHYTYFPPDRALRKERNLKLAREIGVALAAFPPEDVAFYLGALYGRFIVQQSFDTTGVALDAKQWVSEAMASMENSLNA